MRDVRLLDGGTAAWEQAALPLSTAPPPVPDPLAGFGLERPACPPFLVDAAQVSEMLGRPDATLESIRSCGEFVGKTSGTGPSGGQPTNAGGCRGGAGPRVM